MFVFKKILQSRDPMKTALKYSTRQTAAWPNTLRHSVVQRGLSVWRRVVLGCVGALSLVIADSSFAQVGQTPMAASGGVVNRAAQGLRGFNLNSQGRLYYGINAADRGLGYRGSYMTLGGYFPTVEDDLGGLWAADVRGHLSNYGGFFSNIGAVRKQLLNGGSLLGLGVYWDYDGDQNQYSDQLIGTVDSVLFPGGYSYNQVGVSGELLTDWGNLRSNGYIPVGSTGESTGRFASTNILCVQGINAALGGADLEVGAYLPGLADWNGMINVGGYSYGNTRYQLDNGAALVPWFGGVFTRIDLTFAQNWDFSLQYNNDSYFDSTGFARLTYRLGGSRRRNVPDQMEQPMMRNEHIVRAHQEAEVAINPFTNQPWRVIHVDNTATSPGTGSVTNPLSRLGGATLPDTAESIANQEYDIIFVHSSGTAYSNPPTPPTINMFTFQESNQYLIGEGSAQTIPTLNCGNILVSPTVDPSLYPVIAPRANDTGIFIAPTRTGETISGFVINASGLGIDSQSTGGTNTFTDLTLNGGITGISITGAADYLISDVTLNSQSSAGIENNGSGTIQLTRGTFSDIAGTGIETNIGTINASDLTISDTAGSAIIVGGANQANFALSSSTITNSQQFGIINDGDGTITVNDTLISGSGQGGVRTTLLSTGTVSLTNSTIDGETPSSGRSATGVLMEGTAPVTLEQTRIRSAGIGVNVTGNGQLTMNGGGIANISDDGIRLRPTAPTTALDGSASLSGVTITSIGGSGIVTTGVAGQGGNVSISQSLLATITDFGILGTGIGSPGAGAAIFVQDLTQIRETGLAGIQVTDSNLRVENSALSENGNFGINSINASTVLIDDTRITGSTTTGIQATADSTLTWTAGGGFTNLFNDLTVTNSTLTPAVNGITIQGALNTVTTAPAPPDITSQGVVRASLSQNSISIAPNPINLSTINGVVGTAAAGSTPAQPPNLTGGFNGGNTQGIQVQALSRTDLQALNNGAEVSENPTPPDPENITTSVDYNILTTPNQPPQ